MLGAKTLGRLPDFAAEPLITDERRIARGALKPLAGLPRPGEKISLMDQASRGPSMNYRTCPRILFHAHAVCMSDQEPPISARRIKKTIRAFPYRPVHERPDNRVGGVVGARPLAMLACIPSWPERFLS